MRGKSDKVSVQILVFPLWLELGLALLAEVVIPVVELLNLPGLPWLFMAVSVSVATVTVPTVVVSLNFDPEATWRRQSVLLTLNLIRALTYLTGRVSPFDFTGEHLVDETLGDTEILILLNFSLEGTLINSSWTFVLMKQNFHLVEVTCGWYYADAGYVVWT